VTVLLHFILILTVKKFENWSICDEDMRRTKICQVFGPPYICDYEYGRRI